MSRAFSVTGAHLKEQEEEEEERNDHIWTQKR